MGGLITKSSSIDYSEIVNSDKSISINSFDSPIPHNDKLWDPRSPTIEIDRTPIQLTLDEKMDLDNILDPRSPSLGIIRTPIVLDVKSDLTESVEATFADSNLDTSLASNVSEIYVVESIGESKENIVENFSDLRLNEIKTLHKYSPRSPLSDRNRDSLSKFVLRKQAIKAACAQKQPYIPIDLCEDKENLAK